jgi:hypothetical protein
VCHHFIKKREKLHRRGMHLILVQGRDQNPLANTPNTHTYVYEKELHMRHSQNGKTTTETTTQSFRNQGERVKEYKGKFNICQIQNLPVQCYLLQTIQDKKNKHNPIFIPLRNDVFIRTVKY